MTTPAKKLTATRKTKQEKPQQGRERLRQFGAAFLDLISTPVKNLKATRKPAKPQRGRERLRVLRTVYFDRPAVDAALQIAADQRATQSEIFRAAIHLGIEQLVAKKDSRNQGFPLLEPSIPDRVRKAVYIDCLDKQVIDDLVAECEEGRREGAYLREALNIGIKKFRKGGRS